MPNHPAPVLTPEQLASLREDVDATALVDLLADVPPEARDLFLRAFSRESRGMGIIQSGNPAMQAKLERVVAPGRRALQDRVRRELAALGRSGPVDIAIVPSIPEHPTAGALVVRDARSGRDLIALHEAVAHGHQLQAALDVLADDRRLVPKLASGARRFVIGRRPTPEPEDDVLSRDQERMLRAVLAPLSRAPLRPLGELGTHRTLTTRFDDR